MVNHQTSRWFRAFSLSAFVLGLVALVLSWWTYPTAVSVPLIILLVAAVLQENVALPLPRGGTTSLAQPMITAAALLVGPPGAGLVAASCTLTIREIREGKPLATVLANAGQLALSGVLPAWAYLFAGGRTLLDSVGGSTPYSVDDFPGILIPILVLISGFFIMNVSLVGIGLWLRDGVSPAVLLRSTVPWVLPVQVSLGVLGIVIAQVMAVHPLALLLLVFPLFVSRQIYQNYLVLKSLYLDTVRSLVAALEAKDRYTKGHSERVAQYAVRIGECLGLPEERLERLRMAAQLHDLGKVAIRSEVLQKPGALEFSEHEEIRLHPETGAGIVAGVPALRDLAEIVRHHHERYDGTGYAEGLRGELIPLESRVLAIADSYDAMTTARAYRAGITHEVAVAEIVSCSGTQFDPELVRCFVEGVADALGEQ